MEDVVIAVDPGREKCGVAAVHKDKGVLRQAVVASADLVEAVTRLAADCGTAAVVIGDGTSSRETRLALAEVRVNDRPLRLIPVDEHRTTDAARKRYWRDHPPRGLRRLIPVTMQVPPVPVDDYAAVILAERYFRLGEHTPPCGRPSQEGN